MQPPVLTKLVVPSTYSITIGPRTGIETTVAVDSIRTLWAQGRGLRMAEEPRKDSRRYKLRPH